MQFGFGIPTRAPLGTGDNIRLIVEKGEECGLHFVSVADHIFPPVAAQNPYPYTAGGATPWDTSGDVLEMLTLMTFVAGLSRKLRVASGIMVLPLRNPLVTAKALATLDVLSEGRLIVGCGVGWERGEFDVLGSPPFEKRGRVSDEYLRLFKELWTQDMPEFRGEFVQVAGYPFLPKPIQKPHPPIWIGGEAPAAMRRAVELGDGWYPIISNGARPLNTPERYAEAVQSLHEISRRAERDPGEIELGLVIFSYNPEQARSLPDGRREAFTGSHQEILDDLRRYRDEGLQNVMFRLTHKDSLEVTLARMEQFAEKVLSRLE